MWKVFLKYVKYVFKNKYIFVIILFGIWMFCFEQYDVISRFKNEQKIRKLKREIAYYEKEIEQNTKRIIELKSNNENLEKFAREQYLMKQQDEDIFIVEYVNEKNRK